MVSSTHTAPRMHLLDVLRFGAALAVVLYHFTATPTADRYWGVDVSVLFAGVNEVTRYGWLAVEAFFVISGFAILWSVQGRTLAQFTGSRVGRLYPAFWACVAATAVLQSLWDGGRHLSAAETLANATMAPDLFGAEPSQVVYWTLLVELKFYLLIGVALAVGPLTRGRAIALALGWPAVGMVISGLGYPWLAELLSARHAVYFGIGMLLFVLWRDLTGRSEEPSVGRRATSTRAVGAALAVLVVAGAERVVHAAGLATELQGVEVDPVVSVGVLLAGIALVAAATHPRATLRHRGAASACVTAGALTYPLYLVHTQFGWAVTEWLSTAGVGTWPTLAAAVGVSLLLAAAIHHGVEQPSSRPLRRAVTERLQDAAPLARPALPDDGRPTPPGGAAHDHGRVVAGTTAGTAPLHAMLR
ncbi:acyltransferase [Isoptericola sp. b515]|uniref:acyltransferase family protein n=1 Tax=Isoptericola sp. b515 TaxID=3064652 RepID=UPI0027142099|nr:acyltransferase [Isoptericola sp. b515]MDO8148007.1 acyltransferase [Isoptericola sp. b515]